MSINTSILSLFLKNPRFPSDLNSLLQRSQALAIIYTNLLLFALVYGFELFLLCTTGSSENWLLTSFQAPLMLISFVLLVGGKHDVAAATVVCSIHLTNFCGAHVSGKPLAALYGLMITPNCCFLLTHSWKVRAFNFICCFGQFVHHCHKINAIFDTTTITDDQSVQIHSVCIFAAICLLSLCVISFVQRSLDLSLWKVMEENYAKSQALTKEVLETAQAKDAFISSLSHEIRNPLNALGGNIGYLLSSVQDVSHLKIIKNAQLSVEILLNLANNVLDAAKLKSDKMDVFYTEGIFMDIVKKVFTINSEVLKSNEVTAEAFFDKNLPSVLRIDPSRLLQIMMNLVSNALKFTPRKGKIKINVSWCTEDQTKESLLCPTAMATNFVSTSTRTEPNSLPSNLACSIDYSSNCEEFDNSESLSRSQNFKLFRDLKLKSNMKDIRDRSSFEAEPWIIHHTTTSNEHNTRDQKSGYLKVQVTDTGCGISQEQIPKLFEMFVQAHQGLSVRRGGTGLGLWICKQLCQKMGGDIKLYSELNQGTTFVFYVHVKNDQLSEGTAASRAGFLQENKEMTVMVVDDDAYSRDLHQLLLQKEGAKVIMAGNGREALKKYTDREEGFFDLIMMDVVMPDMDGIECAKMIRQWEEEKNRRKVEINFISGQYYNEDEILNNFRELKDSDDRIAFKCYKKPIDINLIKTVTGNFPG